MNKKILIVAAHPDDEVLGCGGTVAKLVKQGYEAYTLILGEGKTSRGIVTDETKKEIEELNEEMQQANEILGIKKVFSLNFPDNSFDAVSLLSIVKEIETIKNQIKPEIIFTHHIGDMNIDHQITHKAVLTATRPMQDECVKEIYSFEIPSSTEWNSFSALTAFIPNVFYDITETIDLKISAMAKYNSELRDYPHPRSLQHINELSKVNGTKVGLKYSENFMLVRAIKN
ncbi:MAG: PIG-L deacetylase family protein [bacterium]